MKAIKEMKKNEHAVSPIVATLVLIVVAVVGAVAVGTIMGAFSGDVGDQMSSGDVSSAAQTEILISGSTTVQPASTNLAKEYMKDNGGIKVNVQGGGSDAGLAAINLKVVDIGMASKIADAVKYPDLVGHEIGGSAVVWIANGISGTVTLNDLKYAYTNTTAGTGAVTTPQNNITSGTIMFQRSEGSGTEETAADFLSMTGKTFDGTSAAKKEGNAGVLQAVQSTTGSIGFVDYGFAVDLATTNAKVQILGVDANGDGDVDGHIAVAKDASASTLKTNILNALKGTATFPTEGSKYLTRPLVYYTNGAPSGIIKNFIDFARSPVGIKPIEDSGAFHVISYS